SFAHRCCSMGATCTIRRKHAPRGSSISRSGDPEHATFSMSSVPAKFSAWRDRVAAARVLVVGDVMLDRYWFGDVERISPEAPVPVAKIVRMEERPGGAANVARNISALGATATLLSVTGDDGAGLTLGRRVAGEGIRR